MIASAKPIHVTQVACLLVCTAASTVRAGQINPPVLLSPVEGETLRTPRPFFSWQRPGDRNMQFVQGKESYDLKIFLGPVRKVRPWMGPSRWDETELSGDLKEKRTVDTTRWQCDRDLEPGQYTWCVEARYQGDIVVDGVTRHASFSGLRSELGHFEIVSPPPGPEKPTKDQVIRGFYHLSGKPCASGVPTLAVSQLDPSLGITSDDAEHKVQALCVPINLKDVEIGQEVTIEVDHAAIALAPPWKHLHLASEVTTGSGRVDEAVVTLEVSQAGAPRPLAKGTGVVEKSRASGLAGPGHDYSTPLCIAANVQSVGPGLKVKKCKLKLLLLVASERELPAGALDQAKEKAAKLRYITARELAR